MGVEYRMHNTEMQEVFCKKRELLDNLLHDYAIETEAASKFKLKHQIDDLEREIKELRSKLIHVRDRIILKLAKNEIQCVFGNKALLGRYSTCDFQMDDSISSVSTIHAKIYCMPDKKEYMIEDLNSANGTYINSKKINKPTILKWGDKIGLGNSFTLQYEYDPKDKLKIATLKKKDKNNREISRFIIIPKSKANLGTNLNDAIKFLGFGCEKRTFGFIEKRIDGFYYVASESNISSEEKGAILLEHGKNLEIDCYSIEVFIPSFIQEEEIKDTQIDVGVEDKPINILEQSISPTGNEIPKNLMIYDIVLGAIILLSIILSLIFVKSDFEKKKISIIENCIYELKSGKRGKYWSRNYNWHIISDLKIICLRHERSDYNDIVNRLGLKENNIIMQSRSEYDYLLSKKSYNLFLNYSGNLGFFSLQIVYFPPDVDRTVNFKLNYFEFLYTPSLIAFGLVFSLSILIHFSIIQHYRRQLYDKYDRDKNDYYNKVSKSKFYLDNARHSYRTGNLAKALAQLNQLLTEPTTKGLHKEATDLKKIIRKQVTHGTITTHPINNLNISNSNTLLYLRVLGTPYAYQSPFGLDTISIGRKRDNDIVIRVPGSDEKSLRISRRHLTISRTQDEYFLVNKTEKNITKLNDDVIEKEKQYRLKSGDKISIANVLTLEILIRIRIQGNKVGNLIKIDHNEKLPYGISIEASIGDLLTEVSYD